MWFADIATSLGIPMRVFSVDIVKVHDLSYPSVTFLEGNAEDLAAILTDDILAALPRR